MTRYSFVEGEILAIKARNRADPQKLGEALEAISAKSGGRLTPPSVVEAARDKKSPLHKHFEWSDPAAAEAYRLDQARSLIRCIHVESTETENGLARAFLSIKDKDGTAYRSLSEVMSSADLQAKVLAAAERDLISFENRFRDLTDICELIRAARERIAVRRGKNESRVNA